MSLYNLCEPASYTKVDHDTKWQQVMTEELDALHRTATWDLVPLPPGKSAVGSLSVYEINTKSDGLVERYKARLFAKGFA